MDIHMAQQKQRNAVILSNRSICKEIISVRKILMLAGVILIFIFISYLL